MVKEFNWQIEHNCPQCGAAVILEETDRLLACSYCRTRLYLTTREYFSYHIPLPEATSREIIYIPYWRLKGLFLSVQAMEVTSRFVDVSLLALRSGVFPHSLGLKPQVLKLKFVLPKIEGRFIVPHLSAHEIINSFHTPATPAFHQTFIGEVISLIYSPVYIENNNLYDALLRRPVAPWKKEDMDLSTISPPGQDGQIQFIPTLCPRCGWDLEGEKASLVLICKNCNSAWSCPGTVFEPVSFIVMAPGADGPLYYLPFWRLKVTIEGIKLASYADLIREGNLPRAITDVCEGETLYFWFPAFKVNPSLFLRWARQMTVFQPEGKTDDTLPNGLYPVTLPVQEALESVKIIIASITADKRAIFPLLSKTQLRLEESLLVYHPFTVSHHELIHTQMHLSIDKKALTYGIGL